MGGVQRFGTVQQAGSANLVKLKDCIRDGKSMIVFAKMHKYIKYILMFFK